MPAIGAVYESAELVIAVTGMGARNAEQAANTLMSMTTPVAVWTCGFAGGLSPQLRAGDVVYEVDGDFPFVAMLSGTGCTIGKFTMVARVAVSAAEKLRLRVETQADAVDMESAAIRAVARCRGFPSATVRVISDTVDEDLPLDFNTLATPGGGVDNLKLALAVARAPYRIPRLIRFGNQATMASNRLADFLANALSPATNH
jgi:adenosylhomocysteine nucleosidase